MKAVLKERKGCRGVFYQYAFLGKFTDIMPSRQKKRDVRKKMYKEKAASCSHSKKSADVLLEVLF